VNLLSGQVEVKLSEAYLSGNLSTSNVYIKSEMDTFISNIATEVNNRTPKTDVSLLGRFRMVSGLDVNVSKIHKIHNSNTYDGFKLSFDPNVLTSCLTMNNCQGGGGCFRAVAPQVGLEASVGLYKHTDLRSAATGDMWVAGLNCWAKTGYTIGTSVTGSCLNISDTGVVEVPWYITTQEIMADTVRAQTAEQITIDDNVIITGNLKVNGTMIGATNP
jgi:hypothetical protein